MEFHELGLKNNTIQALKLMFGDEAAPTTIQEKTIPKALKGSNIIAQARTGSGKTLAFSIPIIEQMKFLKTPEAIILVPTRELCKQVAEVFESLGKFYKDLNLVEVYGGVSIDNQINKIKKGANVIVATPGRLIDIYERNIVNFDNVAFVVLDEADRMLDMGFMPDVQYILSRIKTKPQFYLFSATIIDEIKNLSNQFTGGQYEDINVSKDSMTVKSTKQFYYLIANFKDKYYDFVRILRKEKPQKALIFTNTKKTAEWLMDRLQNENNLGVTIGLLSGDMSQAARERVIDEYRENKINCLIATDVAARGLDIPNVTHVINYDIPMYEENYVHRIGRTSRMDKDGVALTLVLESEYQYLCRIEGFIDKNIIKRDLPVRRETGPNNQRQGNYGSKNKRPDTKSDKFINPFH